MSTPKPRQDTSPVRPGPGDRPVVPRKSATGSGVTALVLAAVAILVAPIFLFIPYFGFLPTLIAGIAVVVAWGGLSGSTQGTGIAMTALIISVALFALLAGISTLWNVVVAHPAISDYDQLHDVINHIKNLVVDS